MTRQGKLSFLNFLRLELKRVDPLAKVTPTLNVKKHKKVKKAFDITREVENDLADPQPVQVKKVKTVSKDSPLDPSPWAR